jgi:hypothetical protein
MWAMPRTGLDLPFKKCIFRTFVVSEYPAGHALYPAILLRRLAHRHRTVTGSIPIANVTPDPFRNARQ